MATAATATQPSTNTKRELPNADSPSRQEQTRRNQRQRKGQDEAGGDTAGDQRRSRKQQQQSAAAAKHQADVESSISQVLKSMRMKPTTTAPDAGGKVASSVDSDEFMPPTQIASAAAASSPSGGAAASGGAGGDAGDGGALAGEDATVDDEWARHIHRYPVSSNPETRDNMLVLYPPKVAKILRKAEAEGRPVNWDRVREYTTKLRRREFAWDYAQKYDEVAQGYRKAENMAEEQGASDNAGSAQADDAPSQSAAAGDATTASISTTNPTDVEDVTALETLGSEFLLGKRGRGGA